MMTGGLMMKTYKAYGQKIINYTAEVQADDPIEAWNVADKLYVDEWSQMEDDDAISTTEIEAVEQDN